MVVIEPETGRQFLLALEYQRTETEGLLFERMRTKLDAVAAYEGMSNVFHLKGTDICRVESCEMVPCNYPAGPAPRSVNLEKVEAFSRIVSTAESKDELFRLTLDACSELLGYPHAFIMLIDEAEDCLRTVASTGYAAAGVGAEVRLGEGLVGIAAARRQTVRVTHMTRDLSYTHASQQLPVAVGQAADLRVALPTLPGLQSQLVTPMLAHRELTGVICLQSETTGAFQSADECVMGILANQLAMAMVHLGPSGAQAAPALAAEAPLPIQVKHYSEDDSVFLDNEYLIKGVAGAILWRLLSAFVAEGRDEFSNKELRLDQTLALPDIKDNLEARLILLRKRLEERCDDIRLERTGRGRFRITVEREIRLVSVQDDGPV